jgi:hypothetical protein
MSTYHRVSVCAGDLSSLLEAVVNGTKHEVAELRLEHFVLKDNSVLGRLIAAHNRCAPEDR